MKKKYVSPMVSLERYELTQTIAGCQTKIGFLDSECVIKDPDSTNQMKDLAYSDYFADSNNCVEVPTGMDKYDSICYHTNANAAFNS